MFRIVPEPIDPSTVECPGAGGFVSFVGRVRNEHGGREVLALEYEAHPQLAEAEGSALLFEAAAMFGLLEARAVHRTGRLAVGEAAVWIGVAAPHRQEAFAACEWIIDEIKRRVPIWKKEHYSDGDSGWIGTDPVGTSALKRAGTATAGVAEEGRGRLAGYRVLCVGAGAVGCASLPHLAGAGVGTVRIVEPGTVDEGKVLRQPLYHYRQAGKPMADEVAAFVARLNPSVRTEVVRDRLTAANAAEFMEGCDIVLDGTDDVVVSLDLNDACRNAGKTLVVARTNGQEGQLLTVAPDGPCLRCLWPGPPPDGVVRCASTGTVSGVLGVLQAHEALKSLSSFGEGLSRQALLIDIIRNEYKKLYRTVNPRCPLCGSAGPRPHLEDWEVDSLESARMSLGPMRAIDVREPEEGPKALQGWSAIWEHSPMSCFSGEDVMAQGGPVVLVCRSGRRTAILTAQLREAGWTDVYSLAGGVIRAQGIE